jgi:hypothetical protein
MAYQLSGRNWATIWVMTMAVSVHILKVDNNKMNQISEGFPKFGCFIFPKNYQILVYTIMSKLFLIIHELNVYVIQTNQCECA